jgi:ABC-type multidrug transport system ATPase subunit
MTGGSAPALATYGLEKRYGARPALTGLDLRVPRGVVYGFLGPNGAGKTTTMRLLVGLLRPDAGRIELLGEPFSWRDRKRLFRVGSLIETPAFYPYLSGRDNLRVIGAAGPRTPKPRMDEVLQFVDLLDRAKDRYDTYSLGMKQRLGIAAALLNNPELLLLDEPANGLDPAGIVAMRQLLRQVTEQGATVFISSHILPEVQQLADIVGIIVEGKLVREGPLAQMLEEGGHVRVRVGEDEVPRTVEILTRLVNAPEQPIREPGGVVLTVRVPPARAGDVNKALAQAGIYASRLEAGSDLEELFLSLTTAPTVTPALTPGPPAATSPPPSAPPQ